MMASVANTFAAELVPDGLPQCPITDRQFAFFQDFAKSQMNITIADHKRNMVYRRVAQRLRALGLDRVDDYCAFLQTRGADGETEHLINALTTNKTVGGAPYSWEEVAPGSPKDPLEWEVFLEAARDMGYDGLLSHDLSDVVDGADHGDHLLRRCRVAERRSADEPAGAARRAIRPR